MRHRVLLAFALFIAAPRAAQAIEWNGASIFGELLGDGEWVPSRKYLQVHGAARYIHDPGDRHTGVLMVGATVLFTKWHKLTLRRCWERRFVNTRSSKTDSYSVLYRGEFPKSGVKLRLEGSVAIGPRDGPSYRGWYSADYRIYGRDIHATGPLTIDTHPKFTGKMLGFGGTFAEDYALDIGIQGEQSDADVLAGPHLALYRPRLAPDPNWRIEGQYLIGHRYTWSNEARLVFRLEY